jgi:hyperosmotically inducible periplasmic protein
MNTHFTKILAVGLLALALAVPQGGAASAISATTAAPAVRAQSQAPTTDLENAVVKTLLSLPTYGVYDNLYFVVNGSDVTLKGQALYEITKAEAGKRVGKLRGVAKVVNEIEVLPPSPSDDALRASLAQAIFGKADLDRYGRGPDSSIHIIVKGGHVTLEGMVSNANDKQRVEMVSKSLPGIMSFTNNLRTDK